jgi:hypothetical protein
MHLISVCVYLYFVLSNLHIVCILLQTFSGSYCLSVTAVEPSGEFVSSDSTLMWLAIPQFCGNSLNLCQFF